MVSGAPQGATLEPNRSPPQGATGLGRVGPRVDSSRAVPTGPAGRRHHCTGPRQRRAVPGTRASDGPRVRACCAAVPCALMAAPPSCRCAESASSCAGGWSARYACAASAWRSKAPRVAPRVVSFYISSMCRSCTPVCKGAWIVSWSRVGRAAARPAYTATTAVQAKPSDIVGCIRFEDRHTPASMLMSCKICPRERRPQAQAQASEK